MAIEIVDPEHVYTDADKEAVDSMKDHQGWVFAVRYELSASAQDILRGEVSEKQVAERDNAFPEDIIMPNRKGPVGATFELPRSLFYAGVAYWSQKDIDILNAIHLMRIIDEESERWVLSRKDSVNG